jgi:hypothetical protein
MGRNYCDEIMKVELERKQKPWIDFPSNAVDGHNRKIGFENFIVK